MEPRDRLSIVFSYYDQPKMLEKQCEIFDEYGDLNRWLRLVVVDDASRVHPIRGMHRTPKFLAVRLFKILDHHAWNQMGARNLGMRHVDGWAFVMDLDHTIPMESLAWIVANLHNLDKNSYHLPRRVYGPEELKMGVPPNLYLIHSSAYWLAGGMDETFRGNKGWSDIMFRSALQSQGIKPVALKMPKPLVAWSWQDWHHGKPSLIADASVTSLNRDLNKNNEKRLAKMRRISSEGSKGWSNYINRLKPLQFKWEEISATHS